MTPTVVCLSPAEIFEAPYRTRVEGLPAHALIALSERSGAAVRAALPTADVIVGDWTGEIELGEEELSLAGRCRAILQPTAGYNCIDIEAAARVGIPVANTPGANTRGVAEWVVMAALAMLKRAPQADDEVRRGVWRMVEAGRDGVYEIGDRTVGILGYGSIGRAVARRLAAFEPRRLYYYDVVRAHAEDPTCPEVEYAGIDDLFRNCDVVSLHLPLTADTRDLVTTRRLELLGPDGVLINTSRGGIVDADALERALRRGVIKGAALDVFEEEPLPTEHRWRGVPNVLLSPHLAGSTNESRDRMVHGCLDNLARVLRGQGADNVINRLA